MRQPRLGAEGVVDVVVAGQAHRQEVGLVVGAEPLALDGGAGEGQRQFVAERGGQDVAVEARTGAVHAGAQDGRQPVAVAAVGLPGLAVRHAARVGGLGQHRCPGLAEELVGRLGGVEGVDPGRMPVHVIGGGRELAGAAHVHVGRALVAGGQDGAAVLAGDADHLGGGLQRAQHVADGLDLVVLRAGAGQWLGLVADVLVAGIGGVVLRRAGHRIAPLVADDAAALRIGAAEHDRVTGRGDRVAMAVIRVGEPGAAVQEALEAVGLQLVAVAQHLPDGQAVNHHEDHQPGRLLRREGGGGGVRTCRDRSGGGGSRRVGAGGQRGQDGHQQPGATGQGHGGSGLRGAAEAGRTAEYPRPAATWRASDSFRAHPAQRENPEPGRLAPEPGRKKGRSPHGDRPSSLSGWIA